MAQFQLPHSALFPGGTRLFMVGDSGPERLVLQTGKQVTLELTGLASPSDKPTIKQVPLATFVEIFQAEFGNMPAGAGPDVVSISPLTGGGLTRTFTIKALRPGLVALATAGTRPLFVVSGDFKNFPGFERDLIADVFRAADPAKMHILSRTLLSNDDNLFNEESDANQRRWCPGYPARRCLPCGTVAKVGSTAIFHPIDYDYQPYSKPVPGMKTETARAAIKREDIKYDDARLKRGCAAIRQRLLKGIPSIVGLIYIASTAVQANGTLNETGEGGHSVPIVGCNVDATQFLYIDVYPQGSKLKYGGGFADRDLFPWDCDFLGMFELRNDAARGSLVLRARPGTEGSSGVFAGNQYLEMVSGPLNG